MWQSHFRLPDSRSQLSSALLKIPMWMKETRVQLTKDGCSYSRDEIKVWF